MLNLSFSVQDLEFFLLIFVRMTAFISSAPFFSNMNVPTRVKAGFGFLMALLIYQFVVPHEALVYATVLGYSILVIKETIAGVFLGLGCYMCIAVMNFAGKIMDMEIGLSMVNIFDPMTRTQLGFTGTMYQYLITLILIISNMHHYLIKAFIESYQLIPTGKVVINEEAMLSAIIAFMGNYMSIAFRICLPVFAAMLMVNAILAILAKTAPQMNMFAVGIQIKIITGLSVLFVSAVLLPQLATLVFEQMQRNFVNLTGAFH